MLDGRKVSNAVIRTLLLSGLALLASPVVAPAGAAIPNWKTGPSMGTGRAAFAMVPLPGGGVLAAGGEVASGVKTDTAETYRPLTQSWGAVGSMGSVRDWPGAAPLPGGKVLVAGGKNALNAYLTSAEIFDPAAGTFSGTTAMPLPARFAPSAVALADGRVLVSGGEDSSGLLASVVVFNPQTQTWSPNGTLNAPRSEHASALLPDGRVLMYGGLGPAGDTYEIYDPATGTSAPGVSLGGFPLSPTATTMADGRALLAGGQDFPSLATSTRALIFSSSTSGPLATAPMGVGRNAPGMALLPDGRVMVAGGATSSSFLLSTEIYSPGSDPQAADASFGSVPALGTSEKQVTITNRGAQEVLLSGLGIAGSGAAQFSIAGSDCETRVLAFGAACQVTIRFAPKVLGSSSANLTFNGSTFDGARTVGLSGTGAKLDLRTTLRKHPRKRVRTEKAKARVTFRFRSPDSGSAFQCRVDKKRFRACKSPVSYRLKRGAHVFRVRAVSALGSDPTPAKFRFKILAG